jgi:hypothetical protein
MDRTQITVDATPTCRMWFDDGDQLRIAIGGGRPGRDHAPIAVPDDTQPQLRHIAPSSLMTSN